MSAATHYRRVSVPPSAHPLVKDLFRIMHEERTGVKELAEKAGLAARTLGGWRVYHPPLVTNLEACLNALGFRLAIVPQEVTAKPIVSLIPPEWRLSPQQREFVETLLMARDRALRIELLAVIMGRSQGHVRVLACHVRKELRRHGWTISVDGGRYRIQEAEQRDAG